MPSLVRIARPDQVSLPFEELNSNMCTAETEMLYWTLIRKINKFRWGGSGRGVGGCQLGQKRLSNALRATGSEMCTLHYYTLNNVHYTLYKRALMSI